LLFPFISSPRSSFLAKIIVVFLYLFATLLISSEEICHFPLYLRRPPHFWRRDLLFPFISSPRSSFIAKRFVVFLYLFAAHLISGEEICYFPLSLRRAPHFWRRDLLFPFISSPLTSFLAKRFVISLYIFATLLISGEEICCFPLYLRRALYQAISLYPSYQKASAATPQGYPIMFA